MLKLLNVENEENGMTCIKILIDGIRSHKEQAEPLVERFIGVIKTLYTNIKALVEKEYGVPGSGVVPVSLTTL